MLMILGGVSLVVCAAVFGTGGRYARLRPKWQAPLRLDSPLDYQVFQRRTRLEGKVRVSGRAPAGTEQVEVQLGGDWLPVAFSKTNGTFGAEMKAAPGGWYVCRVRATAAGQPLPRSRCRMSEWERCSSSPGSPTRQSRRREATYADGPRGRLRRHALALADDPQPGPAVAEVVSAAAGRCTRTAIQGAGGPGGLRDRSDERPRVVTQGNEVPASAHAGRPRPTTAQREWESKGEAFAMFIARLKQLGPHGFRAVLWHQGESDANQKDPTRTLRAICTGSTWRS